jgi:DNA-binding MarR family transcriptional regulator
MDYTGAMHSANDLGYLFQHLASLLAKQSDQVLQEQLGIGYSQFKLLRELQDQPQMKQRDIASHLSQTEASISRQVKLMIAQGLLHVTRNQRNRREHLTQVTAKGMKLNQAAHEVLAKYHQPTFSALSDKQHAQLHEILGAVHAKVCNLDRPNAAHPAKP